MLQCDQTAKNVTLYFLKLHYNLYAPLPVQVRMFKMSNWV